MELGTFGAILQFAMTLEEQAAGFYQAAATGMPAGRFGDLEQGARKRIKRLEQARREGVTEMILESITGLDGDSYAVSLDPDAGPDQRVRQAAAFEQTAAAFYRDAAVKMPIREVARLFSRLAEEHAQSAGTLAAGPAG